MQEKTIEQLEEEIYNTYYDNGGDDARTSGLWRAVIDAKNEPNALNELECVLGNVIEGMF